MVEGISWKDWGKEGGRGFVSARTAEVIHE
jgi:hypothetical protein